MKNICKSFSGVYANEDINLTVEKGGPEIWAVSTCPLSSSTRNIALDRASMIVPSLSIAACLAIESYLLIACSMILKSVSTSGPSLRTATANS